MPTKTKKKPAKRKRKSSGVVRIVQFLQAADWQFKDCVDYGWRCYGPNARILDINLPYNQKSVSAIFDCETGRVFEMDACDYRAEKKEQAYRWVDPVFKRKLRAEARRRGVDESVAWDDTPWNFVSKTRLLNRIAYLCGTLKTKPARAS